jgi:ribosomal protein S27AE
MRTVIIIIVRATRAIAMLTRKELQEKLGELEKSGAIADINRNAKTEALRKIYQDACPAIPPQKDCPVCGNVMSLEDNWWGCGYCGHKKFNY